MAPARRSAPDFENVALGSGNGGGPTALTRRRGANNSRTIGIAAALFALLGIGVFLLVAFRSGGKRTLGTQGNGTATTAAVTTTTPRPLEITPPPVPVETSAATASTTTKPPHDPPRPTVAVKTATPPTHATTPPPPPSAKPIPTPPTAKTVNKGEVF